MSNEIMFFVCAEFGQIRTIMENDKILFCGADAAKSLGYSNTRKALADHCKEKGVTKRDTLTNGGIQALTYIDEGNLYRLIAHSRLPSSERFESWIFDEVLPTIRKTGGYVSDDDLFTETYLPFANEEIKALFKLQLKTIRQLNARIERDQPLVEFAEHVAATSNVIDMNTMAKLAAQKNMPIGSIRLMRWLRKRKILMPNNLPYQKYIDWGYFEVKPIAEERCTKRRAFVTGKGQIYLINRLKAEYLDDSLEDV